MVKYVHNTYVDRNISQGGKKKNRAQIFFFTLLSWIGFVKKEMERKGIEGIRLFDEKSKAFLKSEEIMRAVMKNVMTIIRKE